MIKLIKKKIKKKFVLAIIPARKDSSRLKNKHILKINKKPLIQYTLEAAKKAKKINKTILFTNDERLKKITNNFNKNKFQIYNRPNSISKSFSSPIEYVESVLKIFFNYNFFIPEFVLILQPTSPLRTSNDIDKSITIMLSKKINSLISITDPIQDPSECIYIKKGKNNFNQIYVPKANNKHPITNQQSRIKTFFIDGSIYIFRSTFFYKKKKIFDNKSFLMKLKKIQGIDVNDVIDYYILSKIMKKNVNK